MELKSRSRKLRILGSGSFRLHLLLSYQPAWYNDQQSTSNWRYPDCNTVHWLTRELTRHRRTVIGILGGRVGACFNACTSAAALSDGSTGDTAQSDPTAYVYAATKGVSFETNALHSLQIWTCFVL